MASQYHLLGRSFPWQAAWLQAARSAHGLDLRQGGMFAQPSGLTPYLSPPAQSGVKCRYTSDQQVRHLRPHH